MTKHDEVLISLHKTIAHNFWLDSRDFLARFDVLWEIETHKSGRVKTFVDLLMACECVLKSHAMLGLMPTTTTKDAYKLIRKASHSIAKLAELACFNSNRENYDFLKQHLDQFPVSIRYSLDADGVFFPMLRDWSDAKIPHSKTVENHVWVMSIRACVYNLAHELIPQFTGDYDMDIAKIIDEAQCMEQLMLDLKR
ncbi:hypothetical protein [Deefgea piscis]|uniref:hypothetical protein n=1 Tax=Deefgea piscis TaxID=2739061 RepID=UPI001C80E6E9|nr:hypothetical protein [Deefgea piscis]QZA82527.1 hypothetical protein K4H25_07825 [Deefgea piscis]